MGVQVLQFIRPRFVLILQLLLLIAASFSFAAPPRRYDYTITRISRPATTSIQIAGSWKDSIRFIYNRGEGKVRFLDEVLQLTDPKNIRKIKGYKGPSSTRINLMTYEVRSAEVLARIEELLAAGFLVQVTSDPSTFTPLERPSAAQWRRWSEEQKRYYLYTYDTDRDGKISKEEVEVNNQKRYLSITVWEDLQKLKRKYPRQLDLVSPPYEVVPSSEKFSFPRLTHFKKYAVEFKNKKGEWAPQTMMVSSANLTDSCLNRRVHSGQENYDHYLAQDGQQTFVKGSQGHVQFGAILKGELLNSALTQVPNDWIELYKKGEHFDGRELDEQLNPRVVFEDEEGYYTTIQAFYSEGVQPQIKGQTVDPVMAITEILSQPDVQLKVMYSTQFVGTHPALSWHIRHQLAQGNMEDFSVLVDSKFATEPYSALPRMLFAPKIDNRIGVIPGHSIETISEMVDKSYYDKVRVYEGDWGVVGEAGDKLHSKTSYYEYIDGLNVRHYVVVWGSANQSTNASKQNADGLFLMDSTDPAVREAVLPYFEAMKKDWRTSPFPRAYVEKLFLEMFKPQDQIFSKEYLDRWVTLLTEDKKNNRTQLANLLKPLKRAGALTSYGTNMLKVLEWYYKNGKAAIDWNEWEIALFLAYPYHSPQFGFLEDLKELWNVKSSPSKVRSFNKMVESLIRSQAENIAAPSEVRLPGSEHYLQCMLHLQSGYYRRLGIEMPQLTPQPNRRKSL